jgi:DNA-binding CsgD family transcriptional regulator
MSRDAELIYRAVLEHRTRKVTELSAQLNWAEDDVRATLERLAELHLVQPAEDDPDRVQSVDPVLGLGTLLVRADMALMRHQSDIGLSRAAIRALLRECGAGADRSTDMVVRHDAREAVRRRLIELASTASSTCRTLQPTDPTLFDPKHVGVARISLEMGLHVQEVRQDAFRTDQDGHDYVRELATRGAKVRVAPSLPMRIVLFDNDCALVPLDPKNCAIGMLELRGHGAVAAAHALFEQVWNAATPWDAAPCPDSSALPPRERELLRLLAAGYTDEAASRQLGLSLRTVRRLVARLMELLEASSRFEAGVNAAKRNWI